VAPYEMALENGAGLMSTTNGQERDRVWLFGGMDTSLSASSGVSTGSWRIFSRVRPKWVSTGEPLLRVKPKDLAAAGVERVRRVTGVQHGQPQLEDGRRIDVANVIWCTGFHPGFSWIDLPVLGPQGPVQHRGIVKSEPGLYFLGLKFLYSVSSEQIHGVGRDAAHIADAIAARRGKSRPDRPVANQQDRLDSAQLQRRS
jgi:hypothetical protein